MTIIAQQQSTTSLTQYATNGPRNSDLYGSVSADFCNSFWGPGDEGVNILFARMRGAAKTTEELKSFWNERAAIEEQYATRLAALSKAALGGDEIGELRSSLDTLRHETARQAAGHFELAAGIRSELEGPTSQHLAKHVNHRRNRQASVEKKFKNKQSQEAYVSKAREKYKGDCIRITSYTQQSTFAKGKDLERIQAKLIRAQQTVQANEKDFETFTNALVELMPEWEAEWREFCDTCQDLEEERMEFMKDILWTYANQVSTICVSDDESCEQIRTTLESFGTDRDIINFIKDYGTGNLISEPRPFVAFNGKDLPPASSTLPARPAKFTRVSQKVTTYISPQPAPPVDSSSVSDRPTTQAPEGNGRNNTRSPQGSGSPRASRSRVNSTSTNKSYQRPPNDTVPQPPGNERRSVRQSTPLPIPGIHHPGDQDPPAVPPLPPPDQETGERILFYVEALYDYTATIEEEFDFQTGDVIAVTATPDDGWWSGELLDEDRREEGRHVFPSNFVRLF